MPRKKKVEKKSEKKRVEKKKSEKSSSIVDQFSKLKNLYHHPIKFLKEGDNEKKYSSSVLFLLVIYLAYVVLSTLIHLSFGQTGFDPLALLKDLINGVLFVVVIPFIFSAILFIGVKLFKGKEGFFNVFKPVVYSFVILTLYSLLAVIVFRFIPYEPLPIEILSSVTDTEVVLQIYQTYYAQIGVIIGSIIGVISNLHAIIFAIMGIARYQKMTKSKATLAVIVSAGIIFALMILYMAVAYLVSGGAAV